MDDNKFKCDMCGKSDKEHISKIKKIWVCVECMDDLYEYYKTHLIVQRCTSIYRQMEKKIKEIK